MSIVVVIGLSVMYSLLKSPSYGPLRYDQNDVVCTFYHYRPVSNFYDRISFFNCNMCFDFNVLTSMPSDFENVLALAFGRHSDLFQTASNFARRTQLLYMPFFDLRLSLASICYFGTPQLSNLQHAHCHAFSVTIGLMRVSIT